MTDFAGVLHHQVQTLREVLCKQQQQRCREILAEAEQKAAKTIRDSRGKLHERQRQAVREERRRREQELRTARSRVETLKRRRRFAQHESVLQSAWPLLIEALQARWSNARQRLAWCDMIVSEAAAVLTTSDWVIEHPPTWTATDRDAVLPRLEALGIRAPKFIACEDITGGLRIRAGTACLDGTTTGLLESRGDVEALLLAAWEGQHEMHRG